LGNVCGDLVINSVRKPKRIDARDRISPYVAVGIDAAYESNRIAFTISSGSRIEVSEIVLVQTGLAIEDLAGEPQVVGKRTRRTCIRSL